MTILGPSLFGLANSNRDFQLADTWGKNQFNSSFPASMICYMASKGLDAKFIVSRTSKIAVEEISFKDATGIDWNSPELFFSFESEYSPYHKYVTGALPRVDLVIQNMKSNLQLCPLEIKLTAMPDNTTCDLHEDKYGSELVIRPDTIVYLALSLIHNQGFSGAELKLILDKYNIDNLNFADEITVLGEFSKIASLVNELVLKFEAKQKPLVMQPIWKTLGKFPRLADNCLDLFIWSDVGFLKFNIDICKVNARTTNINRQMRSIIWLVKMLHEFCSKGHFLAEKITNELIYGSRNDKAFAVSGFVTNGYMTCPELIKPRLERKEIKNIILGGGEKLLSPERRFDAIVFSSADIFG